MSRSGTTARAWPGFDLLYVPIGQEASVPSSVYKNLSHIAFHINDANDCKTTVNTELIKTLIFGDIICSKANFIYESINHLNQKPVGGVQPLSRYIALIQLMDNRHCSRFTISTPKYSDSLPGLKRESA